MSARVRRTVLRLSVEYFVVTAPIVIYVGIEAFRDSAISFLVTSPEWAIATIFLTFQTVRMYLDEMHERSGRAFTYLLVLLLAAIALASGINIYVALGDVHNQSMMTIATRWILFGVASVLFIYVAGAAIYSAEASVD